MKAFLKRHTLAIGVGLVAFLAASTAFAATGVAEDASLLDLLRPVLEAFRGGDYAAAGALALVVVVAVARQYGARVWPALGTEPGAAALVLLGSFGATLGAMITGPAALTAAVAWTALKIAFYAAGGFALAKKFAYPVLVKLRAKLPGWAQGVLDVLMWVLDGGKARATAKAEAAGTAAVAANPGRGAAAITGNPEDVS